MIRGEPAVGAGRGLVLPAIVVAAGVVFLSGLGAWQLRRLSEKDALIARVTGGLAGAAVVAPGPAEWRHLAGSDIDYRPVKVAGRFDHGREVHVYGVVNGGKGPAAGVGYFVLTPLETADGWFAIVNRGFVPQANKDAASRQAGQVAGVTTVEGIARQADHGNAFTPQPDTAKNIWFNRDPAAIAAFHGLPGERVAPYTIDARFDPGLPGGLPQGGETIVAFSNNHLQYALTWFGLAAALIAVAFAAFRRRFGRGVPSAGR